MKQEEKIVLPVNITALQKIIQQDEKKIQKEFKVMNDKLDNANKQLDLLKEQARIANQQYDQVVEQNKSLQGESKTYFDCLKKIKKYCNDQNLKVDYTACEILTLIEKALK